MSKPITVSIPPKTLSPNARVHWGAKAAAKKKAKEEAYLVAIASPIAGKMWGMASTHVVYYHKTNRRRDADNFLSLLKATFDGIAQAGVVKDDSGFVHFPIRFEIDKENPRVEIKIEEMESHQ